MLYHLTSAISESSEDTLSVSEDTDEPLEEEGDCKATGGNPE